MWGQKIVCGGVVIGAKSVTFVGVPTTPTPTPPPEPTPIVTQPDKRLRGYSFNDREYHITLCYFVLFYSSCIACRQPAFYPHNYLAGSHQVCCMLYKTYYYCDNKVRNVCQQVANPNPKPNPKHYLVSHLNDIFDPPFNSLAAAGTLIVKIECRLPARYTLAKYYYFTVISSCLENNLKCLQVRY